MLYKRGTEGYKNLHARIARARGKASEFPCIDQCGSMAREWAHRHNTDQMDYANYDPRCRSCHAKYDVAQIGTFHGEANGRCKLTDQQVIEIRMKYSSGCFTHRELADLYGVSRSHIHRLLTGKHREGARNSKESVRPDNGKQT